MSWRGRQLKRPRIWAGGFYFSRGFAARSRASRANFSWLRRSCARLDKTAMLRRLGLQPRSAYSRINTAIGTIAPKAVFPLLACLLILPMFFIPINSPKLAHQHWEGKKTAKSLQQFWPRLWLILIPEKLCLGDKGNWESTHVKEF